MLGLLGTVVLAFGTLSVAGVGLSFSTQLYLAALAGFGPLEVDGTINVAVLAALLMMLGSQTTMAGMFLGVLNVGLKDRAATASARVS